MAIRLKNKKIREERREYERNRYRNLSEEEKNKNREYVRNRYYTMIKVC